MLCTAAFLWPRTLPSTCNDLYRRSPVLRDFPVRTILCTLVQSGIREWEVFLLSSLLPISGAALLLPHSAATTQQQLPAWRQ